MNSNKQTGRIVGVLFLLIFIAGVLIYQFLRGPVFADDFLVGTSLNANQIILSTLLGLLGGTLSILVAVILLPLFKQYSPKLAYLYLSFCILNFVAIAIENYSALSLLEFSREYVQNGTDNAFLQSMGTVFKKNHRWAHYTYLLTSCLPVFVLFYTLFYSKLIPRAISIFGLFAVVLMSIEVLFSIFGISTHIDLFIPIGLIQIFLPFWLMVKGFRSKGEIASAKLSMFKH
ncbi:MAG: DUF4386 domain-containing protein [Chitinophagales bacterium]